jgi:hypothetical protein
MWGGNAISKKWGEIGNVVLNDGMKQGNRIAVFPNFVQGICAQIDLWRSARYRNKRFADAIAIWSGGNWVPSYIKFVKDRVPGMTEDTIINDKFLNSAMGIKFLQAQAWHEAGKPYPAPAADWVTAQRRVFSGVASAPVKKTATSIGSGAGAAVTASQNGMSPATAIGIGVAVAVGVAIAFVIYKLYTEYKMKVAAEQATPPAALPPAETK